METKMITCRIDVDKIERLKAMFPDITLTDAIDRCIVFMLSGGKITHTEEMTYSELEGIRRLKNEAAKVWNDANRDKIREYGRKHRKKYPTDPAKRKEERQRHWLKKLRAGGDTVEQ